MTASTTPPPPDSADHADVLARLASAVQAAEGKLVQMVEAFDHLESGVVLYGPDDRLVFCNRRFREMYAEVADLLVPGTAYADIARAYFRRALVQRTQQDEEQYVAMRIARHLDPAEGDYEWLLPDNTWLLALDRKTAEGGVIGFRLDITARKQAEQKLAQSERRLTGLLEMSSDWYWEQDGQFRFSHVSGGMQRASGIDPAERYGLARWDIPYLGISREQMDEHRRQVEAHQSFRDFQYAVSMADGAIRWMSVSGDPQFDDAGMFAGYRGVGSDITEKKKNESQIRELAEYDYLTGLPNRLLLASRFEFAVRQSQRHGGGLALLFIDLDHFKNINDSLGHHIGDQILAETAKRLTAATRNTDTVARHGGDEFIVMLTGANESSSLARIAEKMVETLSLPYQVAGRELTITPSIGITIWPADGEDLNSLVKNADLAMYHSKSQGRNQFSFFRVEMNDKVTERLAIESALRRALQKNEFTLAYQPIFRLPECKLIGVEALLRWNSETLGSVSPVRFIPIAEETGLIVGIGEWVIREACGQLRRWRDAGLDHFPITVNVSAIQFKTRRLIDLLLATTREHHLLPSDVEIELTETGLVSQGDSSLGTLVELGKQGFRLVIDDFGTGYSNLAYLKRFDISKLKIDQSFVRNITTDSDDAAIVRGIIGLAKSLGLRVVAEGVEHDAQLEYLIRYGCVEAQGYLFSAPLSPLVFQEMY